MNCDLHRDCLCIQDITWLSNSMSSVDNVATVKGSFFHKKNIDYAFPCFYIHTSANYMCTPASSGQTGNPASVLGLIASIGKAVLMTVARRPNVLLQADGELAPLGSLDLVTDFSGESKWTVIGGVHTMDKFSL